MPEKGMNGRTYNYYIGIVTMKRLPTMVVEVL